ncbi:hypothetical protein [uncultured Amphritea sp.]|uniref:hypothetical protein n=1 Tax=uncultured Amphritea sp. TaxID=981605 RepID=UPI002608842B|nr:hypothetical protein [uncultured Amphritea sp.]
MSHSQRYTSDDRPIARVLILTTLLLIAWPLSAMQLNDPRSAAVYILKLRPLINACLNQANASSRLAEVWNSPPCQQLLDEEPQFTTAWQLILPEGEISALAEVPYPLRKPTMDTYSEYKQLAERIARLSR